MRVCGVRKDWFARQGLQPKRRGTLGPRPPTSIPGWRRSQRRIFRPAGQCFEPRLHWQAQIHNDPLRGSGNGAELLAMAEDWAVTVRLPAAPRNPQRLVPPEPE
jgi:hypothetical protein